MAIEYLNHRRHHVAFARDRAAARPSAHSRDEYVNHRMRDAPTCLRAESGVITSVWAVRSRPTR